MGVGLLVVLLAAAAVAIPRARTCVRCAQLQQGPFYYSQAVNHFGGAHSGQTFQQKYYVIPGPASGPVFLYISGEAPLGGFEKDEVLEYATHFGATLVTLEHRYYGSSLPLGSDFTSDNLALLTVEQALADLAQFVSWFAKGRKVVTFGCSYAGAMSAWFRVRYPNVTAGSVSSSGVVNPILDFVQFDMQIAKSLQEVNPRCLQLLREANRIVEAELAIDPVRTMAKFIASGFDEGDFLYFIADAAAETVQYGYQDTLCDYLSARQPASLADKFAKFVTEFYIVQFLQGDVLSYSRDHVAQPRASANRAWWWQTCSQLAFFQTAPSSGSIRSHRVNLDYFKGFCAAVFGAGVWPDVSKVVAEFGGNKPAGSQIFFLQSSQDPWQWAGVRSTLNSQEQEYTVECSNCGHCSDTRGCPSLPPIAPNSTLAGCHNMTNVLQARVKTAAAINNWL